MDARRSARNSPCAHKAQEGVKGGTLAGGSPFAGGLRRPQPVRCCGRPQSSGAGRGWNPAPTRGLAERGEVGGGRRQGSSRTPTPTAGGRRAVCRIICRECIPRPGGGRRNVVRPACTVTAGRRGRRPLQGGCGTGRVPQDLRSAGHNVGNGENAARRAAFSPFCDSPQSLKLLAEFVRGDIEGHGHHADQ